MRSRSAPSEKGARFGESKNKHVCTKLSEKVAHWHGHPPPPGFGFYVLRV